LNNYSSNMKQIFVRNLEDWVYYLSPHGFSYGKIVTRILESDNSIKYRVRSIKSYKEYMGDEILDNEIFSNKEDMLEYYKKKIHEL